MPPETAHPEDALRRYLHDGEELLWSGRPKAKIRVRFSDLGTIFFGVMILLFMIMWISLTIFAPFPQKVDDHPPTQESQIAAKDTQSETLDSAKSNSKENGVKIKPMPLAMRLLFGLFALPFLLMGFYLAFGRLWYEAKQRAKTVYGLTEKRLLILSGGWTRKCHSLDLATMTDLSLEEFADGSGDIRFGPTNAMQQWFANFGWPNLGEEKPKIELVPEAATLFRLIQERQHPS